MEFKPVTSSNIASIGYDAAAKRLEVKFLNGGHYAYEGVPAEIHAHLMTAQSQGKYFASYIKGHFPHTKIA